MEHLPTAGSSCIAGMRVETFQDWKAVVCDDDNFDGTVDLAWPWFGIISSFAKLTISERGFVQDVGI